MRLHWLTNYVLLVDDLPPLINASVAPPIPPSSFALEPRSPNIRRGYHLYPQVSGVALSKAPIARGTKLARSKAPSPSPP